MPTTLAPASLSSFAVIDPTLPKPWTTTVLPAID
jgi:hypothetical protein